MALDLAKRMGISVGDAGRVAMCSEVDLLPPSEIVRGNEGQAYCKLRETVIDRIAVFKPREVWIEEAVPTQKRSLDTLRFLMGLCAVAEEAACSQGVPVFSQAVGTVRLQVLGNGAAGKEGVLWWAHDLGYSVTDNEGDALALLAYAASCDGDGWKLTPGPNAKQSQDQIFARAEAALRGQTRPA